MRSALNGRQVRALKLAVNGHVTHKAGRIFPVRLEYGDYAYLVDLDNHTCTCPDSFKGNLCKHRLAAYLIEQANKANQEQKASSPAPEPNPSRQVPKPEPNPDEESRAKAHLVLNAQSSFLRESIIYARLELEGQSIDVEIIKIDEATAIVRSLPKVVDGQLVPQFPFPDKKAFTQVMLKSLTEILIYR
jgi:hypothetical protein